MTADRPLPAPARRPWHRWSAYAIVVVAAGLRFYALSGPSLWLDELWSLEIAAGHGAEHRRVPVGRVIDAPPDLTGPAAARPAWAVWTHMDGITHPPGYYLLLRAWTDAFGTDEAAARSLSAACSAATVAVLFVAVRAWAGPEPALWAAALAAVAGPQVHAAQDARPYAALVLLATAALWVVGRTTAGGPTRRRWIALSAVLLAMLLTHYFAMAAVAAVGGYGWAFTRGRTRRHLVGSALAAGAAFALAWGPFMWRQRAAFSTADPAAAFLREAGPGHVAATLLRLLTLPASMVVDARPVPPWYAAVGVAAYAAAAFACRRRRWPAVWPLLYVALVGLLAVTDLAHSTAQLNFLRYVLLASPVVYAVVATARPPAGRAWAAAAVGFAAWSLPTAYVDQNEDFRSLGRAMRTSVHPGDLVVFAGPAATLAPQVLFLAASHYAGRPAGPVLLLESPADASVLAQVGPRPTVWMVADPTVRLARQWLPGYHLAAGQSWPVVGSLLRMERDSP